MDCAFLHPPPCGMQSLFLRGQRKAKQKIISLRPQRLCGEQYSVKDPTRVTTQATIFRGGGWLKKIVLPEKAEYPAGESPVNESMDAVGDKPSSLIHAVRQYRGQQAFNFSRPVACNN